MKKLFLSCAAATISVSVFAAAPQIDCQPGVKFAKTAFGHKESYQAKIGLKTAELKAFKVDETPSPANGCHFEFSKTDNQCLLLLLPKSIGDIHSPSEYQLQCVDADDQSRELKGGFVADWDIIKPYCPTDWGFGCSTKEGYGDRAGDFHEELRAKKLQAHMRCAYPADVTASVGNWFCAMVNKKTNKAVFTYSMKTVIRGGTTVPLTGPGASKGKPQGLKDLFKGN